ncbi:MAG: hypothetical protein WC989_03055 [Micavibrio sp.]
MQFREVKNGKAIFGDDRGNLLALSEEKLRMSFWNSVARREEGGEPACKHYGLGIDAARAALSATERSPG